ncbi:MAG: hypothetical protein EPN20_13955, partial [Magnetospirillum sp.]
MVAAIVSQDEASGAPADGAELLLMPGELSGLINPGEIPEGAIVLAQADIAPPPSDVAQGGDSNSGIPGVSEEDLSKAHIRPFGSTLVMTLPDGRVMAVPGYFPGQNIGLPPDVVASGAPVMQVSMVQFETSVAKLESAQVQQFQAQPGQTASNQPSGNPGAGNGGQPGGNAGGENAQQANNSNANQGGNGGGEPGHGVDPAIANLIGLEPGPEGAQAPGDELAALRDVLAKDPELANLLQETGLLTGTALAQNEPEPQNTQDYPVSTEPPQTFDDPRPPQGPPPEPTSDGPGNFFGPEIPIGNNTDLVLGNAPPPPGPPPITPLNVGFLSSLGGGSLSSGSGLSALGGSSGSLISRSAVDGQNGNAFSQASLSDSIGSGFSASGPSGSLGSDYGVGGLSGSMGSTGASGPGGSLGSTYSSGSVGGSFGSASGTTSTSGSVGSGFSASSVSGSTGSGYGVGGLSGSTGSSGASGPGGSLGSAYSTG